MLRTIVVRNDILKEVFKKAVRLNSARALSVECTRRRHRNNQSCLLKSSHKVQWKYNLLRFYADLPSHQKVKLPALSPTMETGTIISWEKKEGDKLNEGDLLAEIETDKATMGFETPEEGYLAKIVVPKGSKNVPVGKIVCIIVQNKEDVAAFKDFKDDSSAAAAPVAPARAASPPPAAAPSAPSAPKVPPPPAAPSAAPTHAGDRVYASPMAKRLAEQRQIRLQGKGTGMFDSITSKDLPPPGTAAAPGAGAPPPMPSVPGATYTDIPLTSMRATIAKRLLESKQTIPHYYLTVEVNVDKLLAMRSKMNKMLEKEKAKISLNDFIVKATALSCQKTPEANSYWMGSFIRQFKTIDVCVAVATDKGLITPIIFNANHKGLVTISKEVKQLADKAKTGRLQPNEFQGGGITISNLGMYGINEFSAVINPPQSAIMAVGTTVTKLIPDEKSEKGFKEAQYVTVTMSFDHRVVDGAVGATWLQHFRKYMEDPETMLL